ncbi:transcription-repair coupling factor [Opitutaceae bacterium TAV5]|nr:transcription-repair coupling factor [Opitutaceae bacterium TAV5]
MSAPTVPPGVKHTGVCPSARGAVIAHIVRTTPAPVWLVVAPDLKLAEQLADDTAFFHALPPLVPPFPASPPPLLPQSKIGNRESKIPPPSPPAVLVFPESLATGSGDMGEAFAASADRQTVLSRLRALRKTAARTRPASPPLLLFTTPAGLLQSVPALEEYASHELTLSKGATVPFQELLQKLQALDYDSEAVCESPGHYAIRGGIIDVYPVTATQPYRLDFFGDELEDIRAYDPVTQRSDASVNEITIAASPRLKLGLSRTGLAEYLGPATQLVLVEPSLLDGKFSALPDDARARLNPLLARCAALHGVADLDEAAALFDREDNPPAEITWDLESLRHHRRYPSDDLIAQDRLAAEEQARDEFFTQLGLWRDAGCTLVCALSKEGEEQRARELLGQHPAFRKRLPHFATGTATEGFLHKSHPSPVSPPPPSPAGFGFVLVTETELFGRHRARRTTGSHRRLVQQRAQVDQLLDFSELVEGDFVVHLQHGIAVYRGLTKIDVNEGVREVISLEFDEGVTLHVPLQESHLISRYVGLSKTRPQLGKIGSNRWEKTRRAAEHATLDLAADLLRLQAAREAQPGHAFDPDNDWQKEFEASFPFTETRDQLRAIEETKADMERPRPMDRLICGDVGFGKTEVAIRAAFKAVQGGRQVALLVPTTVLAQQHLNTFRERMAGYPVVVEMISRFRTRGEVNRIVAATAAGQVDILIGTHRILNKDVSFKNLGLVIIDEEQRFGVKHKERLKNLRATVDVLSMSATPIPRTLYMAMTGARDMSVIETAPVNRHPIETIVKTYDDKIVVDAIRREIARGGQVFYLHNRVQTIDLVAANLARLLPDVSIGVGHGQMDEHDLERRMTEFVAGEFQVLVCTTIIETGLDIANCNTIIIEGADRFGLSQLYQLRGRVGRFKHQAYAWLLLHRHTRLVDVARERLNALRAHNQLGAGFRIAMRDLELRGAGNLLGAQQSGHIVGVGFELYCQLLRQSVSRLKGEKTAARHRANVKLDFVFVGESEAGDRPLRGAGVPPAPESGLSNPEFQIPTSASHATSYTAIKAAEAAAAGAVPVEPIQARLPHSWIGETRLRIDFYRRLALAGTPDQLRQIEADLRDRFGEYGEPVRALLLVTEIRIRAEEKGLILVETQGSVLKCVRAGSGPGRPGEFVQLGTRFPRLTAPRPLLRLREILTFLQNLPATT